MQYNSTAIGNDTFVDGIGSIVIGGDDSSGGLKPRSEAKGGPTYAPSFAKNGVVVIKLTLKL